MASEPAWTEVQISDVGRVVTGRTPASSVANAYGSTIPFITPTDLDGRKVIRETLRSLSPEGLSAVRGATVPAGAVLVSCIGSDMGKAAVAGSQCVTNQQINSVLVCDRFDREFIYYNLLGRKAELRQLASGAAQPILNKSRFSEVRLSVPSLTEQRRISSVLSALDDRIDHNHTLAANLEAIARALFKSWFVDFDPVRAKAAGEAPPGFAPDIAALFPDRFVDSELGEIPEGWSMRTIADLAEVVGGSTPSTRNDDYWIDGQHYWATPKDLAALSSPVLLGTERKVTDAGLDQISSGLLPPGTVLLSSRAPIGYLAIAAVPVAINQGFIAMKPKVGVSNLYLLYWAETSHEAIVANANGSTFLEISKKNFRPIHAIDPGADVMAAFDSVVSPMFERIVCAEKEIATLTELRDLLLPRLISGKLRVEDAEAVLEAA